jgi:hypothetical protein
VKKTHDYIHHYRGYWSEGGECRIRIYQEDGQAPVVVCSQPLDNDNTSVTNMAEYLAVDIIEEHSLHGPPVWVEHYPEQRSGTRVRGSGGLGDHLFGTCRSSIGLVAQIQRLVGEIPAGSGHVPVAAALRLYL